MQSRDLLRNRRDEVIDWFRGLSNSFGFLVSVFLIVTGWNWMVYRSGILFDRQKAIRLSGMSEKAYTRSFNSLQNGLGVKWVFDFSFACSNFDVVFSV